MAVAATHISFTVYGRPQQVGSKTPWIPKKKDGSMVFKNGKPVIATMDDNKRSKPWMAAIRHEAGLVFGSQELMQGPVELCVRFYFKRPKSHFRTGRFSHLLKESAPLLHCQTPDLAKLVRCLEDALTGVIWLDDKQVCRYRDVDKVWTTESERAEIEIMRIGD